MADEPHAIEITAEDHMAAREELLTLVMRHLLGTDAERRALHRTVAEQQAHIDDLLAAQEGAGVAGAGSQGPEGTPSVPGPQS